MNDDSNNDGNFKAMIRYRISAGDTKLENHLKKTSAKATYISKTTQNDLIDCCGDFIRINILNRVKQAKFYSIIFDETTDISTISQMCLIIRYVYEGVIREDFLDFVDCHYNNFDDFTQEIILSGKVLGQTVKKMLIKYGLNLEYCIGISTDGCKVMTSDKKGAVIELQSILINAIHCPCYNHAINLSISKTSNVSPIQKAVAIMKETISFFNPLKPIVHTDGHELYISITCKQKIFVYSFRFLLFLLCVSSNFFNLKSKSNMN